VQEDVHAIGLSSYNGGHVVFFREVLQQLRARGASDVAVFGGGGGTITPADERVMKRSGVDRIFFAGTPLDEIVRTITRTGARPLKRGAKLTGDRALARAITLAEMKTTGGALRPDPDHSRATSGRKAPPRQGAFVLGVTGPGGAGKSTLIDELTSRFLRAHPTRRLAILANDPSRPDSGGAILGDRVSAIYAQDDRVFFRSLATRGSLTGLSAAAPAAIEILRRSGEFDLILVESIGIGQESDPFGSFARSGASGKIVDAVLFVLAPHYGGQIQLQKIALLNAAELVALNKCDDPRATTAKTEITTRLGSNGSRTLHATTAAHHQDSGVDALFEAICERAALETRGGERPCYLDQVGV
jgi:methylmalonyl-CoA mutase